MKILIVLPFFLFTLSAYCQTEDEVHIGTYPKGKTFGKYQGPDTKPYTGQITITGIVTRGGVMGGRQDSLKGGNGGLGSFTLKKEDGTLVTVGTTDFDFTVPKEIVKHRVIVEGIDPAKLISDRRRKTVQKDIQYAAIGIKVVE
jgi:hypothetical protein